MSKALQYTNRVLIVFGLALVFIISAVVVGIAMGASIAIFDGSVADGKLVKGVGIVQHAQTDDKVI